MTTFQRMYLNALCHLCKSSPVTWALVKDSPLASWFEGVYVSSAVQGLGLPKRCLNEAILKGYKHRSEKIVLPVEGVVGVPGDPLCHFDAKPRLRRTGL